MYVDALIERDRDTDHNGTFDERLYVQQDANFNVTALVNTSGTVVERYAYDAYGVPTILTGSWGSASSSAYDWRYLHQGGRYDIYTGLYSFRHRDYNPTLGRWIEQDPIGLAADVNLYRYEGNRPSAYVDPLGTIGIMPNGRLIVGQLRPVPLGLGERAWREARTVGSYCLADPIGAYCAWTKGAAEGAISGGHGFAREAGKLVGAILSPVQTAGNIERFAINAWNDPWMTISAIGNSVARAWNENPSEFLGGVTFHLILAAATLGVGEAAEIPAGVTTLVPSGSRLAFATEVAGTSATPVANAMVAGQVLMVAAGAAGEGGDAPAAGNAGNFRQIHPVRDGIDLEALKEEFLPEAANQFNVAVGANDQLVLVPVRPGAHPNVEIGINLRDARLMFPRGGG